MDHSLSSYRWSRVIPVILAILVLLALVLTPRMRGQAAAALSITPLTWNVVGLDSTNVLNGPNGYLVGAHVCNTGDVAVTAVNVQFLWEVLSTNPNINLENPAADTQTIPLLDHGTCQDIYFNVIVTRSDIARNTARQYYIVAFVNSGLPVAASTPHGLEIYVAPLTPQANPPVPPVISPITVSGPTSVFVGGTYQYVGTSTITETIGVDAGYPQLVHLLDFPTSIFRVLDIQTTYTYTTTRSIDSNYADACGWINNPAIPGYLSCTNPGDVIGGSTQTTYTVQVVAPGTVPDLSRAVYAYSAITDSYIYKGPPPGSMRITAIAPDTLTPTISLTPTRTITPTITLTPTTSGTPTRTVTVTGTPHTPTVTGTLTPNPAITNSVSPTSAKVNQNFTFTIRVTNNGNTSATTLVVRSTYPNQLTLTSASSTSGSAVINTSTNTVTTEFSSLAPGASVTITVVGRVNSTATTTVNLTNQATLTYSYGNFIFSRTSNTVFFQVIGTSTLPGTGEKNIDAPPAASASNMAAVIGVLLLGLGAAGILFSLRAKARQPYWADWFLKTGIALFFIGAVFGLVSLGLRPAPPGEQPLAQATVQPSELDPNVKTALARGEPPIIMPEFPFAGDPDEPAQLPDFPVPSPTIEATAGPTEKQPDTSEITRISIPALNLDTVVKYVPFDGYSWMIAGLNQEIAWMGETSWPGLGGNTALAGHVTLRSGADGPFRYLSDLGYGDEVHVYTEENEYVYQVREQQTVSEGDLSVVDPSEQPRLTLITCTEWSKDAKMYLSRLVVVSDLVKVDPLVNTTQGN